VAATADRSRSPHWESLIALQAPVLHPRLCTVTIPRVRQHRHHRPIESTARGDAQRRDDLGPRGAADEESSSRTSRFTIAKLRSTVAGWNSVTVERHVHENWSCEDEGWDGYRGRGGRHDYDDYDDDALPSLGEALELLDVAIGRVTISRAT